ncbi:MAG: hypothetical protein HOK30_13905 [Rhodospirillaceae bacterium]|nr:hypothetical protein [Rhodospirillaceae bacterium]MBT5190808.1 hypothetical protein [Rhodospirillaceae bacterium]MBT5897820.1 hypothetical protein [Rhodospirillaceae bacterium]MBT6428757.1 hypothetical protein [Rhodospirillaceae bacterium]MBT7756039.1 hypothetical protein [Rhodospirillaceae bacterium]
MKTSARRIICFALALGLVSLLGQCQPVPKPFASLNKGDFSTIQIGPRAGVIVLPITGDLPEGVAVNLAEAMAKALRRREVTASTGQGHSRSHYLWCEADLISRDRLQLSWRLTGSEHYETLTVTQTEEISSKAWLRGDDALLQSLAGKAADQVDRQLRRRERGQGRRIAFAPVTIGPVDGVPGQGGRKLAAAMQAALADAGVPLSDSPLDDGFILLGSMHVSPDGTDQRIEMVWHLIRPDGREFGTISQANTVPRAQVSGDWGNLASAIAKAGAPGVRDLLRRDPG